jgi:hypothetical protein
MAGTKTQPIADPSKAPEPQQPVGAETQSAIKGMNGDELAAQHGIMHKMAGKGKTIQGLSQDDMGAMHDALADELKRRAGQQAEKGTDALVHDSPLTYAEKPVAKKKDLPSFPEDKVTVDGVGKMDDAEDEALPEGAADDKTLAEYNPSVDESVNQDMAAAKQRAEPPGQGKKGGKLAAEPDSSDTHVTKPLGSDTKKQVKDALDGTSDVAALNRRRAAVPGKKMNSYHFLSKMKELTKPYMTDEQFDTVLKSARAHAGGKAKADNRAVAADAVKASGDDSTDMSDMYGNLQSYLPDSAMNDTDGDNDADDGAQPKIEKADVRIKYRKATIPGEDCGHCRFFSDDDGSCRIVEGFIQDTMTCNMQADIVPPSAEMTEPPTTRDSAILDFFTASRNVRKAQEIDLAHLGSQDQSYRLFFDTPAMMTGQVPDWIPFLPEPGTFEHPRYGKIRVTRERNQEFVDNFKRQVYQDRLPLDVEHETKLGGAYGWVDDMRMNPTGSADAHVEWTGRGRTALSEKRFRYISPEWYEEWVDPSSGVKYKNVAIGGALTTRPFFKDKALRPLVASEKGLGVTSGQGKWEYFTRGKEEDMSVDPTRFAEMETRLQKMSEENARIATENTRLATEAKAATDAIAVSREETQTRRFTDEVLGRSDANNERWVGDVERSVKLLKGLSKTFGEDSEEVREFMQEKRSAAAQLRKSALFSELGTTGTGAEVTSMGQINAVAAQKRQANSKLTKEQAFAEAIEENPALYDRYNEEKDRASRARRG